MSITDNLQWGMDPNKWVIKKSSFGLGWCIFPPNDNDVVLATTFDDALEIFRSLLRMGNILNIPTLKSYGDHCSCKLTNKG